MKRLAAKLREIYRKVNYDEGLKKKLILLLSDVEIKINRNIGIKPNGIKKPVPIPRKRGV